MVFVGMEYIVMEYNQDHFVRILKQLRDMARLQENMLTSAQIDEAFQTWNLEEAQFALIHEYLRKNHIGIDEPGEVEETLSHEDATFLEMYFDDLKKLPPVSEGQKRAVMMAALAGDSTAQIKLVEMYLLQVVEIARLYVGQGAGIEDLIGEGNVAVATAVSMLDCVEEIDEVEGFIGKMIMDAMEAYIGETSDKQEINENVLDKVNEVNDKAKELYDSLLRKVTVGEVANELGLTEEAIVEAVKFSANHIDYIDMSAYDL